MLFSSQNTDKDAANNSARLLSLHGLNGLKFKKNLPSGGLEQKQQHKSIFARRLHNF